MLLILIVYKDNLQLKYEKAGLEVIKFINELTNSSIIYGNINLNQIKKEMY